MVLVRGSMRADSYEAAERYLSEVPKFTRKNPLEQTREFYDYIQGLDEGCYAEERLGSIVHIAGTNGKGSVCAFIESVCIEAGKRVGMFTSPHLVTTRERFRIDGTSISEEEFVEAFNWLDGRLSKYKGINAEYEPSYFERLFFMGVYVFAKAGVEFTILETGLGGRLDTTNVIRTPKLCVITEIGFDHMEYLGDTLVQIAGEKAGIIKQGVPVVFCGRRKEVSDVLRRKASSCGAVCHCVSEKDYKINEIKKKSIDFSVHSRYYDYGRFNVGSTALYQAENAALAVRACELLKFDGKSIKTGIENMRWPGRMEEILPGVYIDGAHNEDGIEAFAASVESAADGFGDKCILIFSAVKDKDYDKMIRRLSGLLAVTEFVVTHIPDERGADLAELTDKFGRYSKKKVRAFEKPEDALEYALLSRGERGRVYIVGSLYLAGFIKERVSRL